MADIVERMGPEWVLSGTKGVTDRTFPAIARFALDSSQQTRLVKSIIKQSILEVAETSAQLSVRPSAVVDGC